MSQVGYFDDSWHGRVFTFAGYVADSALWDDFFTPAWREVLDAFGLSNERDEYRHGNCCSRSGRGRFREWPAEQRVELTNALLDIITTPEFSGRMLGLAVSLVLPQQGRPLQQRQLHWFSYLMAVAFVARGLLLLAEKRLGVEDGLELVFGRQSKLEGRAKQMIAEVVRVVEHRRGPRSFRLSGPHFRDSHLHLPLQAADLLANETFREANRVTHAAHSPPSPILRRLLHSGILHYALHLDAEMIEHIQEQRRIVAEGGELDADVLDLARLYDNSALIRGRGPSPA